MIQRVTIQVNTKTRDEIIAHYSSIKEENNGEYILFFGKGNGFVITVYTSKKVDSHKVFFLGETALEEAKKWDENASFLEAKETKAPTKACWEVLDDQIGSDEVGTGDFFGPICVCAAYVKASDIRRLRQLGVDDSKRLTDDQIRRIGKILIKEFEYSQLSLNNEKYNELVDKNMNMNEMKVKMHNRCLLNLRFKHKNVKPVFVDEFTKEETYYKYLEDEHTILKGIKFKTKGESYYPSVAVGSIIARYSFVQHMDLLSKKYKMEIPYGASAKVTEFAKKFMEKYGINELEKIVKKNFANFQELTKLL